MTALITLSNILRFITWLFPLVSLMFLAYYIEYYTKYKTKWRWLTLTILSALIYAAGVSYDYWTLGDSVEQHLATLNTILLAGIIIGVHASLQLIQFQKISIGKTRHTVISLLLIAVAVPFMAYHFKYIQSESIWVLVSYEFSIIGLVLMYLCIGKIAKRYLPQYNIIAYTSTRIGAITLLIDPIIRDYILIFGVDVPAKHLMELTALGAQLFSNVFLLFSVGLLIDEARTRGLHIVPTAEQKVRKISTGYRLKKGYSYFIGESKPDKSSEIFVDLISKGYYGLGITRTKPEQFREMYSLRTTPILWMTNAETDEKAVKPTDLDRLLLVICDFIQDDVDSVILIQRLDYIITQNSFAKTLNFIQTVNDRIMSSNCVLLVSVDPSILGNEEMSLLSQELQDLGEKSVRLSESSYELLNFVYGENKHNRMPSFVDVSEKFSITKTTARTRIQELESKGLLKVIKEGKYKLLEVTDKGRNIIVNPVGTIETKDRRDSNE